jgi:hypothetical protein
MVSTAFFQRHGDEVSVGSGRGDQGCFMNTVHAWFSQMAALRLGSTVYRKASGSTVNVTRTSAVKESEGLYKLDEKYLGEVIEEKDGGGVGTRVRVGGITR